MIKAHLQSFNVLSEKEIEEFITKASKKQLKKNEFFISEGDLCKEVAFIRKGILRSYYISDAGEEITYCITFPNQLMTAYSAFITGEKSAENMQAITPVELLIISKSNIQEMAENSPNWMKFLKIIAEQQYVELEKRVFQFQKNKAVQRYIDLINNHPEYVQNIPVQYLASYLGISHRHLSRIRREISFQTNVLK